MTPNPYAPPAASVADAPAASSEEGPQPPFFATSPLKVLVLSVCTLGLYQYYWFFRHWKQIRERAGERLSPFWRTMFAPLFCYQLFHRFCSHRGSSAAASLAAGPLALAWIIPGLVVFLPDPHGLLAFLSILALMAAQAAANAVNSEVAPRHAPNRRFTSWNWIGVVFGGPIFLLVVVGAVLPPQEGDGGQAQVATPERRDFGSSPPSSGSWRDRFGQPEATPAYGSETGRGSG